jgi:hypothetical protein
MTERRHESEDLEDFTVLDSSETLAGPPGDDPLDRGVAPPERWSRPIRTGGTAEEQETGESLDELLAEEEPDIDADGDDDDEVSDPDENAPDYDVQRALLAEGPDARAGRLIIEDGDDAYSDGESVAHDAGVDSGGATAEEAAVHVLGEEAADSGDRER